MVGKDLVQYSYYREASANFAQRDFWDESFGQTSDCHVLGVFCYGNLCKRYLALCADGGEQAVIDDLLAELDGMFDGRASACHVRSAAVVWPREPFVRTGYTHWSNGDAIDELQWPVGNQIFFAGEAIPVDRDGWGFVHGAALSGKDAARKIAELKAAGERVAVRGSFLRSFVSDLAGVARLLRPRPFQRTARSLVQGMPAWTRVLLPCPQLKGSAACRAWQSSSSVRSS